MRATSRTLFIFALVGAFAILVACGDDVVEGDNTREIGNDGQCMPGYDIHPITDECVPVGNGANNQEEDDNQGGGDNDGEGENDDPNQDNSSDNSDPNNYEPGACGPGAIEGQACRPDETALSGAQVSVTGIDCETGQEFTLTTTADENGIYTFDDVPAGQHTVQIEAGSFSGERQVTVEAGQTARLLAEGAKLCVAGDSVNIAVIEGQWDDVGSLLDGMDIDYDVQGSDSNTGPAIAFLEDLSAMMDYNIIFIECGTLWGAVSSANETLIKSNIRQFVESGRSLYASDQSQAFIQESMPEAVNFHNENEGITGPRVGDSQTVNAYVVSPEMQLILPGGTTSISFNLPGWAVADANQPANTSTHFSADVAAGGLFSTYTVNNASLMVSHSAQNNGRVIFTSFHNSAQASGDMQEILEFMIFQL